MVEENISSPELNSTRSADMLLAREKEALDRADRILARNCLDSETGENKRAKASMASVRVSLTQQQRRSLVHEHLKYKWSMKSSQAAIIKTNTRPVFVSRLNHLMEDQGNTSNDMTIKYSGWCPVCKARKQWCGFKHETLGRERSVSNQTHRQMHMSPRLSNYEARVKSKAARRRGNKVAESWKNGKMQRLAALSWNQDRTYKIIGKTGNLVIEEDEETEEKI
jgi:hypothetical protein